MMSFPNMNSTIFEFSTVTLIFLIKKVNSSIRPSQIMHMWDAFSFVVVAYETKFCFSPWVYVIYILCCMIFPYTKSHIYEKTISEFTLYEKIFVCFCTVRKFLILNWHCMKSLCTVCPFVRFWNFWKVSCTKSPRTNY